MTGLQHGGHGESGFLSIYVDCIDQLWPLRRDLKVSGSLLRGGGGLTLEGLLTSPSFPNV